MENLFLILMFVSIFGIFYFRKKDKKKRNISIALAIISFILFGILVPDTQDEVENTAEDNEENEQVDDTKEEKVEVEEEKEVKEEVENEIKDNNLFNKVYYKIASRDQAHEKDAVTRYLEANDFIFEEDIELNSLKVEDDNTEDGDYVYITFNEMEDEPDMELISSISYFLEKEELEAIFSNNSTKKEAKYDNLQTHKLGESNKKVESLEEQVKFLKETKNEHKVNKEQVEEKATKNEKDDPIELILDIEEMIKDGKVSFNINTNLPNNTTGNVALVNESIDYTGQDGFEVKDGKAEAGPYSMKGESLPSGTYKVSISTPLAQIQPDDVFIEIGPDYSNYSGDNFSDSETGRTISHSFEVNIP